MLLGVAGAAVLTGLYRSIQSRWPEAYGQPQRSLEYVLRTSWVRLLLFRLLPPFAISLILGGYAYQWKWGLVVLALSLVVSYFALNPLRVILESRGKSHETRTPEVLAAVLSWLIAVPAITLGSFTGRAATPYLLTARELAVAITISLLVAVFLRVFQSALKLSRLDSPLTVAAKDVGEVWLEARREAIKFDVDPVFILAIIAAESLQRPKWFRRIERLFGRFRESGTYGVAQVRASRPLSDIESVRELARSYSGYWPDRDRYQGLRPAIFNAEVLRHCYWQPFADEVQALYQELSREFFAESESYGEDGFPLIRGVDLKRDRGHYRLTFALGSPVSALEIIPDPVDAQVKVDSHDTISETILVVRVPVSVHTLFISIEAGRAKLEYETDESRLWYET